MKQQQQQQQLCEKSLRNCGGNHWCIIFLPTNKTTTTTKRKRNEFAAVEFFFDRWRTTTTTLLGKSLEYVFFWCYCADSIPSNQEYISVLLCENCLCCNCLVNPWWCILLWRKHTCQYIPAIQTIRNNNNNNSNCTGLLCENLYCYLVNHGFASSPDACC
jgi:hypothetical protein